MVIKAINVLKARLHIRLAKKDVKSVYIAKALKI